MAKKVTKQVTKPTAKSAKKPTAKKTTTKQGQGKEQGGLEEALTRSEQFFENYKKTIYTIVALIIVIIAGGMIYTYKIVQPREVRASEAIFPGETYFMNGDFRTALEGNAYGFEGFEALSGQYGNTKAGKLAKAYAGLCCAQLDSFEVAAKYLAKFKGKDQMASPSVLGALASCYANMDQLDKAVSTYKKAAKKAGNNLLSPYYYFQAALVYEALEKPEEALKLYKKIKVKYPESVEGQKADKYIARISSK
ncbi:MAG TPA: hypothetical protein DCW98_01170 [Bacteroidales bacterium]|jgi:tetratricopeptide (TPR) repeat protein|nr:hypothetical protein [Bacteroidales bacterium]